MFNFLDNLQTALFDIFMKFLIAYYLLQSTE